MPTTTHRFTERATVPFGRIDKAAGVIHDVRIIGTRSRNRRTYTRDALQAAVGKYEGVHVNVNHPKSNELNEDRQFDDWAGVLKNVSYRDGALYGDLHLRRSSRWFDQIVEAATDFPKSFGLSHVADGDSRIDAGEEIVDLIDKVFSVDVVLSPATNSGLFESFDHLGATDSGVSLTNCGDKITEVVGQLASLAAKCPGMVPEDLLATCVSVAGTAQAIQMMERRSLFGEGRRQSFAACRLEAVRTVSDRTESIRREAQRKEAEELSDDIRRSFGSYDSSADKAKRFADRLR